jgi:hypothetical protein
MRFSTLLSLSTAVAAVSGQYLNQSAPFQLELVSTDASLNGQHLASCHEGAAIESLCLYNVTDSPVYYYNYSDTPSFKSTSGYLTYLLQGANFAVYEPLSFIYNVGSNVAVPMFSPADSGLPIAFDESNLLYVPSAIDDTQNPINPSAGQQNLYRWYICTTYAGYTYQTLSWALGQYPPQNPTCCPVNVRRIFVLQ